jgi:hypothetical protein
MKSIIRAFHHRLTGIYPEDIKTPFTRGAGTLRAFSVAFGFDSIKSELYNVPIANFPMIIVDLAEGPGLTIDSLRGQGSGTANGCLERTGTVRVEVIVRVQGDGKSIIGSGQTMGILDAFDTVADVLFADPAGYQLRVSGVPYADEIVFPIQVTEGYGVDPAGKIYARARKFEVRYKTIEL